MTIHDRAGYKRYLQSFMGVFEKYEGEVLVVSDDAVPIEGEWPYQRTVVLRFPDQAEARRWFESEEYRAIAVDRQNSTKGNVIMVEGFAPQS
jgi:uncharacterized protein (DUF1330 family)